MITLILKSMRPSGNNNYKAFTLIELLVVVAIIGILAAVGVVAYNGYTKSAKQNAAQSNHKLVVNFVTTTMLKTTLNDGYFEGMYENDECKNPINKKITPDGLDGVSKKFMTHLRCLIKTHPFNDPTYPAVNWGPRKILGSVEFHNECINILFIASSLVSFITLHVIHTVIMT